MAFAKRSIRPHLIAPPTPEAYLETLPRLDSRCRGDSGETGPPATAQRPLSAILFLVAYAVSGSLFLAVGIAVTAGLVQLASLGLMGRRIEPMQWMSLGLVVVLGGATMLTQSPRFMMIKPTIVHFAVAAVMLRPGWMIRYLPEKVVRNVPEPAIVAAGYGWAALLAALGLANLFIALRLDIAIWAWFISVGSVGTKLAAFALQYGVFRAIVRQRVAQSAT